MARWASHFSKFQSVFWSRATEWPIGIFENRDLAVLLNDMLSFNDEIPPAIQMDICKAAIRELSLQRETATIEGLLASIDDRERKILQRPTRRFCLVSRVNLTVHYPRSVRRIHSDGTVRIGMEYPSRYLITKAMVQRAEERVDRPFPFSFPWISVFTDSKTELGAGNRSIRIMDRFRGLWALAAGGAARISFGGLQGPLAQIQTSPVYVLFDTSRPEEGRLWWEASRTSSPSRRHTINDWKRFRRNERWFERMLKQSVIPERFETFFVSYAQALDEPDRSNSLMKVWAAIEKLVGISNADYGKAIRRLIAVFDEERGSHEALFLNVIRRRRNSIVHSMDGDTHDADYVGALCGFVTHVVPKLLMISTMVASPRDFDEFRDLPKSNVELGRQVELRAVAQKFRSD